MCIRTNFGGITQSVTSRIKLSNKYGKIQPSQCSINYGTNRNLLIKDVCDAGGLICVKVITDF
jgi:hypothetical protein